MISRELVAFLRKHFRLDWGGIHGAPHWARVRLNGLRLARLNGASFPVVELFAFLHDACREHDGRDAGHGGRAADLVGRLEGRLFTLGPRRARLLAEACRGHSAGESHPDLTVRTCWDADRLDLGRVGIVPDPWRLCTPAARMPEIIEEAYLRSVARP